VLWRLTRRNQKLVKAYCARHCKFIKLLLFQAMASTTSTIPDDPHMIHDLYVMFIDHQKKTSLVCPPAGVTPSFNPEIKEEIPDGVNNRGKCYLCVIDVLCMSFFA
jgi:hypothetical protein